MGLAIALFACWPARGSAQASGTAPAAKAASARIEKSADESNALRQAREHFEAGSRAYARGELAAALQHFEAAQALAPSNELLFDVARTLERMGEPERAIASYERYLAAATPTPAQRHDIEERIAKLREQQARLTPHVVKAAPSGEALRDEARQFFGRGVKLFRRGQYAAARSAFDAALQFADVPELHFNLALVAERLDQPEEALAHYHAYLKAAGEPDDRAAVEHHMAQLRALR